MKSISPWVQTDLFSTEFVRRSRRSKRRERPMNVGKRGPLELRVATPNVAVAGPDCRVSFSTPSLRFSLTLSALCLRFD